MATGYGMVATIAVGVVVLDQITKWFVHQYMYLHQSIPLIDGVLSLTYVRNSGAAFGLFADLPWAIRVPLLVAVSVGALVVLVFILRSLQSHERALRVALAGVVGGAIGNLIDRVRFGEVVDFVDVYWRDYHWPAFNVADSCITVGIAVLLFHSLWPARVPEGA